MCAGNQSGDVEELYRYTALAVNAGAVVRLTSVGGIVALAGAFDLEVAYGTLWVDGGESVSATEVVSRA